MGAGETDAASWIISDGARGTAAFAIYESRTGAVYAGARALEFSRFANRAGRVGQARSSASDREPPQRLPAFLSREPNAPALSRVDRTCAQRRCACQSATESAEKPPVIIGAQLTGNKLAPMPNTGETSALSSVIRENRHRSKGNSTA